MAKMMVTGRVNKLATFILAILIGYCRGESTHQNGPSSDGKLALQANGLYEIRHEKVLRLLKQTYEKKPELEVFKILSRAEDREAEIDGITVQDLINLNSKVLTDCLAVSRENRQAICKQVTLANLKLYCGHCEEKLEEFCKQAPLGDLIEIVMAGRWGNFRDMLFISNEISAYIETTGDEEDPEAKSVADFCNQERKNLEYLRYTCDEAYGWLASELFPFMDQSRLIDFIKEKYFENFTADVAKAMDRCKVILSDCKPRKCGFFSCFDWLSQAFNS